MQAFIEYITKRLVSHPDEVRVEVTGATYRLVLQHPRHVHGAALCLDHGHGLVVNKEHVVDGAGRGGHLRDGHGAALPGACPPRPAKRLGVGLPPRAAELLVDKLAGGHLVELDRVGGDRHDRRELLDRVWGGWR